MPLQPKLTRFSTASPTLVNFDSVDVANGTGYETYYLIESEDASGKDYHLTPDKDYSNTINIGATNATSDLDYDLTAFVIPRTVNGTVLISIPVVSDGSATFTFISELYRWDGATETQIGSTVTFVPTVTTTPRMLYMRMDIDNELIPAGDSLRFRLSMTSPGAGTVQYGQDPAGRTSATLSVTTTSKISVPYKLDL